MGVCDAGSDTTMTYCKHGHAIRGPQDRTANRTCCQCAARAARDYQRRIREDARRYRQLQELLQID